MLYNGLNNPCRLLEKLFDSLVTPILTYGSEAWGVDSTFKDSDPFEKLHIMKKNLFVINLIWKHLLTTK
jgi:hypothetical protein